MMRADIKSPIQLRNIPGRPLLVVIHATKGYDCKSSAAHPIGQTVDKLAGQCNILEIEDRLKPSYLRLPSSVKTSLEYAGILLHAEFFRENPGLFDTDTFIFIGGKINRCLLNAVMSVLIAKTTPLEQLFIKRSSFLDLRGLLTRPLPPGSLDLHFIGEAAYPSHSDLKRISRNDEYLDWSPNLPWINISAMSAAHNKIFNAAGMNYAEYLDGNLLRSSNGKPASGTVNIYYWSGVERIRLTAKI